MQAPSTTFVLRAPSSFSVQSSLLPVAVPTEWYSHSSSPSSSTALATRFQSSFSVKCAPSVQHPSSGRPA